jgi:hypothetical protein
MRSLVMLALLISGLLFLYVGYKQQQAVVRPRAKPPARFSSGWFFGLTALPLCAVSVLGALAFLVSWALHRGPTPFAIWIAWAAGPCLALAVFCVVVLSLREY